MDSFENGRPSPAQPADAASQALQLARRIGPASAEVLTKPESQTLVLFRMHQGLDLEDSVLGVIHGAAVHDRQVANEFLAYFLSDLMNLGHSLMHQGLRRFLDTGDLVNSVLGNFWKEMEDFQFRSRGQFLAYMIKGLRWKAQGHVRNMHSGTRREDLRKTGTCAEYMPDARVRNPASLLGSEEDLQRFFLVLARLRQPEREILSRHLKGERVKTIAQELGLSVATTRKTLQRVIWKARCLI